VNKILALAFALAFSLNSFGQLYGIYLKDEDFTNNTPIKGVDLKETSGPGPSNMILKLADGTKRTFKAGTFWGLYKVTDKKNNIVTQFRVHKEELYPIFSAGELIVYLSPGARHEMGDDGEPVFRFYYTQTFVSKGAEETLETIGEFYDLKKFMNPDLFPKVEKLRDKDRDLHLAKFVEYYNELAKKKRTEEEE